RSYSNGKQFLLAVFFCLSGRVLQMMHRGMPGVMTSGRRIGKRDQNTVIRCALITCINANAGSDSGFSWLVCMRVALCVALACVDVIRAPTGNQRARNVMRPLLRS